MKLGARHAVDKEPKFMIGRKRGPAEGGSGRNGGRGGRGLAEGDRRSGVGCGTIPGYAPAGGATDEGDGVEGPVRPGGSDDLAGAVDAARHGDEQAFRTLYRAVQPGLLRYLRFLVGDDAEDVASETWLQIVRDLPSFSGDGDGFRGWAATIGRHRAMDHVRRHRRRPAQPVPVEALTGISADDDTAARAVEVVSTETAIALIATLPQDQAEAVLLRVVLGLSADAAGQVLGKRAGAVRTATYRGLRRLAERFADAPGPSVPAREIPAETPRPHSPVPGQ
jgi:RNA polymerase sigma-70 factor, ECF subfamily